MIVPGGMADARGWVSFAAALNTRWSIAIVNRRGRAPSDSLPSGSSVADEVTDMLALLSELQGPFVLIGWSYGGLLAMEAALHTPDVISIVLYEPVSAPFVPGVVEPIRASIEAGDLDMAVELVITRIGRASADQVSALRRTPAWGYLKPLAVPAATELTALNRHQPDFEAYAKLRAPVSILVGALNEDREPYGIAANRFLEALPHAAKVVLPRQGHLAHVEDPVLLAETVASAISAASHDRSKVIAGKAGGSAEDIGR